MSEDVYKRQDTIELTDNEKKLIDEAISAGLKIYGMTVTGASDCLLKAARACLLYTSIVLHFVRTAIGTQTAPPNQVLVGLALFLTLFIM